jgi:hypothetical protein
VAESAQAVLYERLIRHCFDGVGDDEVSAMLATLSTKVHGDIACAKRLGICVCFVCVSFSGPSDPMQGSITDILDDKRLDEHTLCRCDEGYSEGPPCRVRS